MKTTRLTLVIRTLNYLVDQQEKYPVDDIYSQIEDGTIFDKLRAAYAEKYDDVRIGGLPLNEASFANDERQIVEALQRLANGVTAEEMGVTHEDNGLLFLAALLLELIQANSRELNFQLR